MMQVLLVLTHNISSTKYDLGKNPGLSVLDTLPNSIKEELMHVSFRNLYGSCFREKNECFGLDHALADIAVNASLLVFILSTLLGYCMILIYFPVISCSCGKSCLQHWTSLQELLRHYWSSYPITTMYLYNKVNAVVLFSHCATLNKMSEVVSFDLWIHDFNESGMIFEHKKCCFGQYRD
jgi:hypothetical protein